jgi:hypothetical protein
VLWGGFYAQVKGRRRGFSDINEIIASVGGVKLRRQGAREHFCLGLVSTGLEEFIKEGRVDIYDQNTTWLAATTATGRGEDILAMWRRATGSKVSTYLDEAAAKLKKMRTVLDAIENRECKACKTKLKRSNISIDAKGAVTTPGGRRLDG